MSIGIEAFLSSLILILVCHAAKKNDISENIILSDGYTGKVPGVHGKIPRVEEKDEVDAEKTSKKKGKKKECEKSAAAQVQSPHQAVSSPTQAHYPMLFAGKSSQSQQQTLDNMKSKEERKRLQQSQIVHQEKVTSKGKFHRITFASPQAAVKSRMVHQVAQKSSPQMKSSNQPLHHSKTSSVKKLHESNKAVSEYLGVGKLNSPIDDEEMKEDQEKLREGPQRDETSSELEKKLAQQRRNVTVDGFLRESMPFEMEYDGMSEKMNDRYSKFMESAHNFEIEYQKRDIQDMASYHDRTSSCNHSLSHHSEADADDDDDME